MKKTKKPSIDDELQQSANEVVAQLKDNEVIVAKEEFEASVKAKKEKQKQATEIAIEANQQAAKTIKDEDLPPAYIMNKDTREIEVKCVIDNEYVPYDEAQIIFQERRIEREQLKLEKLKNKE